MVARSVAGRADQAGKASAAAPIARETSSGVAAATWASGRPVAGSATSKRAPSEDGTHSPPMKSSSLSSEDPSSGAGTASMEGEAPLRGDIDAMLAHRRRVRQAISRANRAHPLTVRCRAPRVRYEHIGAQSELPPRGLEMTVVAADREADFVQSLQRGLGVIRAFDADEPALTLSDVAAATGLARAAARRFLLTLVDLGYVRLEGRLFRLSPRVLE